MTEPGILKLTTYFAERERAGGRFLTDALLDLYEDRRVATSIVLRGIAGFGPHRVVRTDESLSLSEDLPVAIVATDTAEVIGPVVDEAVVLMRHGLVTVERAESAVTRLTDGDVRLGVYLGRRQRSRGAPAYLAVTDLMHRLGFAGVIVYLGVDGTTGQQRRRAKFFSRNTDVPVLVLAVGTAGQAGAAAAELARLEPGPQLTVERIRICKRAGRLLSPPPSLPATDAAGLGLFQKLTVFTDEDDRHDGQPIHRALVRRLRGDGHAGGATVLRGLWGFTGAGEPHGDRMFALGRRVPVATVIIDTPAGIARSFEIVDELTTGHGLVTCETVPAMLTLDGDQRFGGTTLARLPFNQ
ncbi:MAG: DUF190 domain-containing protein [Mycobacterium sp.]|nr:DUF190 domain-containing protein [Mycobacterium sp.]